MKRQAQGKIKTRAAVCLLFGVCSCHGLSVSRFCPRHGLSASRRVRVKVLCASRCVRVQVRPCHVFVRSVFVCVMVCLSVSRSRPCCSLFVLQFVCVRVFLLFGYDAKFAFCIKILMAPINHRRRRRHPRTDCAHELKPRVRIFTTADCFVAVGLTWGGVHMLQPFLENHGRGW